jgi:PAS domain-containing protein
MGPGGPANSERTLLRPKYTERAVLFRCIDRLRLAERDRWSAMRTIRVLSSLFVALENMELHFRRARDAFLELPLIVMREPRMLREAILKRRNTLRTLLTDSSDAIVVLNDDRCLLAANPPAIELFGVSQKNISKFSIDAFLPVSQVSNFKRKGVPFLRGKELRGKCEIRRLDGCLRVAEFSFQPNFVPGRHLSRFHDITCRQERKPEHQASPNLSNF